MGRNQKCKQNSKKLKANDNCRPKMAGPSRKCPIRSVCKKSYSHMKKHLPKKAMHFSQSSSMGDSSHSSSIIHNLLNARSTLNSNPYFRNDLSQRNPELTMPFTNRYMINRTLSSSLEDKRHIENIRDRLVVSNQNTREILFDALKFGETQGIVKRVDLSPGEYCWVFTSTVDRSVIPPKSCCYPYGPPTSIEPNSSSFQLSPNIQFQQHQNLQQQQQHHLDKSRILLDSTPVVTRSNEILPIKTVRGRCQFTTTDMWMPDNENSNGQLDQQNINNELDNSSEERNQNSRSISDGSAVQHQQPKMFLPPSPHIGIVYPSTTTFPFPSTGMMNLCRRPRGEKKPIPEEMKDDRYFERRKRNNQAAKKSRDARRMREDQIAFRATVLEQENAVLRAQILTLREEAQSLRQLLLLQRKTSSSYICLPTPVN